MSFLIVRAGMRDERESPLGGQRGGGGRDTYPPRQRVCGRRPPNTYLPPILTKSSGFCIALIARSMLRCFRRKLQLSAQWRTSPPTDATRPLVIVHGLFGSSSNFRSPALQLAKKRPVLLADLRNHGASPWSDDCSLESMADDLIDTLDAAGVSHATLCGHSLGGKVAMVAALRAPQRFSRLIVVDIAPVAYSTAHPGWRTNLQIMDAMLSIPDAALGARGDADKALVAAGVGVDAPGVRAFLLQNLIPEERRWRFNLRALREAAVRETFSGFPELPPAPATLPVRFICGATSDYALTAEHYAVVERIFPGVEAAPLIINAGHWVHAEKPAEFVAAVDAFAD
jgi:esterase